jgi:hypothetical protein
LSKKALEYATKKKIKMHTNLAKIFKVLKQISHKNSYHIERKNYQQTKYPLVVPSIYQNKVMQEAVLFIQYHQNENKQALT